MVLNLERAAQTGPPKNKEKSSPLRDKIFEFKHKRLRILYFYDAGRLIVCTHHFTKKTNGSTPQDQINHAVECRNHYFADKRQRNIQFIQSL